MWMDEEGRLISKDLLEAARLRVVTCYEREGKTCISCEDAEKRTLELEVVSEDVYRVIAVGSTLPEGFPTGLFSRRSWRDWTWLFSLLLALAVGLAPRPSHGQGLPANLEELTARARAFGKVRYVMVLDSSGSMKGFYTKVRQALTDCLDLLKPGDVITLMHFNSEVFVLADRLEITAENRDRVVRRLQSQVSSVNPTGLWTDIRAMLFEASEAMRSLERDYPDHLGVLFIFSDNIDDPPPWTDPRGRESITRLYNLLQTYGEWGVYGRAQERQPEPPPEEPSASGGAGGAPQPMDPGLRKDMAALERDIARIVAKGRERISRKDIDGLRAKVTNLLTRGVDEQSQQRLVALLVEIESLDAVLKSRNAAQRLDEIGEALDAIREQGGYIKTVVGESGEAGLSGRMGGVAVPIPEAGTVPVLRGVLGLAQLGRWVVLGLLLLVAGWLASKVGRERPFLAALLFLAAVAGGLLFTDRIVPWGVQVLTRGASWAVGGLNGILR